mmetsp:Transcript_4713/g.12972  ORF Transcript_4713/g.12972 Transcript_4713/m.12972 type:complete len:277 (-) Transcript_4713:98-928(-)
MPAMREGDWVCSSCLNHNYASRQVCNRCGAPRKEMGGAYVAGSGGYRRAPPVRPSGRPAAQGGARFNPYAAGGAQPSATPVSRADAGREAGATADMKDGDWLCPSCGNHNYASRVTCNRCAAVREGFRAGDWICRACRNHNYASRAVCKMCNAPRPEEARGAPQHYALPPYPAYPVAGYLSVSGYTTRASAPLHGGCYGGKCMLPPPPAAPNGLKEGDWVCPNCANHNYASRVQCNRCSTVRQGMKAGDWICRSCGNHNYASREVCKMCQAPKVAA